MGALTFSCPITGQEIDPGIEGAGTNQPDGSELRFVALNVRCPHCGEHHELKIGDGTFDAAA
jgi:phage terminase large subunit GpA-like protein